MAINGIFFVTDVDFDPWDHDVGDSSPNQIESWIIRA